MEPEADLAKKSHRERHSGRKAEKKKAKTQPNQNEDLTAQQRNPKAFAINSAIRAERRFRRKKDMETKKQHVPLVDRNPIEPPPIMIAVVGPPRVGKSTLINNLIKLFTRSPLSEIKGPVTIVTGKKRRITFIECNNDVNSMIDLAKVADLVLLICDASVGFEMEVFEFLNICQVHGMPKIMGVLNHLDMLKTAKLLKARKKELKHRFWTEVYPGAKLFYLSGIVRDEYLRNEVKNLGRFISVMKFRPLTWRQTHSYLLGDRYEDLTPFEVIKADPKCDRNICLYGYVRGIPIKKNGSVHLAGLGDLKIHDISFLPDPCPLPDQIKKRALIEKEKTVYAPFSGVGGIVYDKDAVYVESEYQNRDEENEFDYISSNLADVNAIDVKRQHSKIQMFTNGEACVGEDLDTIQAEEEEEEETLDDNDEGINEEEDEDEEEEEETLDDNDEGINEEEDEDEEEATSDDNDEEEEDKESQDEDDDDNEEDEEVSSKKRKDDDIGLSAELEELRKNWKQNSKSGALKTKKKYEDPEFVLPKKVKQYEEELVEIGGVIRRVVVFDDAKGRYPGKLDNIEKNDVKNVDEDEEEIEEEDEESAEEEKEEEIDDDGDVKDDEEEDEEEEEEIEEESEIKWKENLLKKAKDAYLDRQASVKNLMKLVYGVFDPKSQIQYDDENVDKEDEEEEEELGDLFTRVSRTQQKQKVDKDSMNLTESSLAHPWNTVLKDWLLAENKASIANCFVTGSWKKSEDANELLRLDNEDDDGDDEDMFGDFEDFETGTKYSAKRKLDDAKKEEEEEEGDEKKSKLDESATQSRRDALAEKKKKLKEKFNADYDNGESDSKYYDELKSAAEKQAALNKSVFENMPDDVRVQIEGCRPGMYVRIEFKQVPCEFVENFDPRYPLVVGALNMGEENIGYVNVRIKKHRWYKKILKTNDPIVVSMGWRRFQTLPIFSKLEDDLKFRYLKYTPEHLSCNAHFWGPMTPQGTGFLALQSVESNPEILSKQGFRIAATGVVQELDKSTRIMKKLKLIGHPMKIYKKTAFIKDMFTSALEVSRFEGARLLTTSKIRGQIKKAVSKPQGCFRATFEDKILLSDIVFLRTWYQVDVQQYYNPVVTLLLPPELKNSWQGVRTCGEIKKANNIQVVPNQDNLYTEVVRQVKPFKPLVVPAKLQKALPYRDKPKNSVKFSERKKKLDRVAVIREPHEQKIATLMKRVKTTYQHKQAKLKEETKARLQKHRDEVEAREAFKDKKLKQKKKEVFRKRSKNKT